MEKENVLVLFGRDFQTRLLVCKWTGELTPITMLLKKLVRSWVIPMRILVTSISVAGGGRLKAVLVAEIEIGMLRFWHFLAVTAVARAKRAAAGLNMAGCCQVGGILN